VNMTLETEEPDDSDSFCTMGELAEQWISQKDQSSLSNEENRPDRLKPLKFS